ncbi:MAG: hypothetical protein JRN26_02525 [Nitrososphaerota archaeon]|nr:hypothetical protein [Nitrososphaerota archaeon]MDG6935751.1 hypothetical protein [Nitrososphaerota archaeon]MDG6944155.1 hypothetical protein [Nitrososphaerota archaeon]
MAVKNSGIADSKFYENNNIIFSYVKKNQNGFQLVNDLEKLRKKNSDPFLICLANGTFKWNNGFINGNINLSQNGIFVATTNANGRKVFEGRILEPNLSLNIPEQGEIKNFLEHKISSITINAFRWISGGVIPVLELSTGKRYAVLVRRDSKAQTHAGHLSAFAGLSENTTEMIDPKLIMIRELYEELIIFNKDISLKYTLSFEGNREFNDEEKAYLKNYGFYNDVLNKNYRMRYLKLLRHLQVQNKKIQEKYIEANLYQLGSDHIHYTVDAKNGTKKMEGNLVICPLHGDVSIIGTVLFKINVTSPDQIKLVDFDSDNGRLLFRDIYLIDEENLEKMIKGYSSKVLVYSNDAEEGGVKPDFSITLLDPIPFIIEKPLLTSSLRQSLINCYNNMFKKHKKISEFGYQYKQSKYVNKAYKGVLTE